MLYLLVCIFRDFSGVVYFTLAINAIPEFSQPMLMESVQNIKSPLASSWLAFTENGQVKVTFSSREAATIQTVNTLYHVMLIAVLILLVLVLMLFMLAIPKHRIFGGIALMIGVILYSQSLLPWSLHGFNGSESHLATRGELCGYLLLNIMLFYYLTSIIPKLSLAIIALCTQLPKKCEQKTTSVIGYASQSGQLLCWQKKWRSNSLTTTVMISLVFQRCVLRA